MRFKSTLFAGLAGLRKREAVGWFSSLFLVLTGFICEGYLKIKPAVGEEKVARESSEPQGKEARDPTKEEERMRRFFNIASQLHHDAQCYLMKVGFGAKKLNPSMRLINDVVAYWSDEDRRVTTTKTQLIDSFWISQKESPTKRKPLSSISYFYPSEIHSNHIP